MNTMHTCFCIDPVQLSRPNKDLMSQQTIMELLISDFEDKSAFRDEDGYFCDIKEWCGIVHNEAGEVLEISWEPDDYDYRANELLKPGGSMDFSWLPPTVKELTIPNLQLEGTIDTFSLPRSLSYIDVENNSFAGSLKTAGLPSVMFGPRTTGFQDRSTWRRFQNVLEASLYLGICFLARYT